MRRTAWLERATRAALAVTLLAFLFPAVLRAATAEGTQATFSSPEDAVAAMVGALRDGALGNVTKIVGPGSGDWLLSGDEVADRAAAKRFVAAYDARHRLRSEGAARAVLTVGVDDWPMPVPLVKTGMRWRFDAAAGREEVLARRIGRNELDTIQVLKAMADAQIEYARAEGAGTGQLAYAQKFASSPGKKDGLYWPVKDGEPTSPLGPLVAQAATEGYTTANLTPYHGYLFRILTAQGSSAPGGAFDYIVKGAMIGGFAIVAYPANYGVSGVMTFVISHDGVVYQKDLGTTTAQLALKMTRFDPGPGGRSCPDEYEREFAPLPDGKTDSPAGIAFVSVRPSHLEILPRV
jgi:hypothetical protein